MSDYQKIIDQLPYKKPFLFVDHIESISDDHLEGSYKIKKNEYFFEGHFPGEPIVPGVILIEIMAQIGLVCFGIHLIGLNKNQLVKPIFSSARVDFLGLVEPEDELKVKATKIYFRFNKLRCEVECINLNSGRVVCKGTLDGMMIKPKDIEGK